MFFTQQQLLQHLDNNHIPYKLYQHVPLVTVEQGLALKTELNMPGTGIKNLFLKDDHKNLYLISATFDTKINLRDFGKTKGIKGIRFASADLLMQHLGVLPGSVTPLALIHDPCQKVRMIVDSQILEQNLIQIHPLQNDATIVITPADLIKFFGLHNRNYQVYDFNQSQSKD